MNACSQGSTRSSVPSSKGATRQVAQLSICAPNVRSYRGVQTGYCYLGDQIGFSYRGVRPGRSYRSPEPAAATGTSEPEQLLGRLKRPQLPGVQTGYSYRGVRTGHKNRGVRTGAATAASEALKALALPKSVGSGSFLNAQFRPFSTVFVSNAGF